MAGSMDVKISGDARGAVKAINDFKEALKKAGEESEKTAKETKQAVTQAERLGKQADPMKRYNDQMTKLANAVQHGGLELKDAIVQAQKYGMQLENAGKKGVRTQQSVTEIGFAAARALAPIMALKQGFDQVAESVKKAQELMDTSRAGRGQLRQVAKDQKEFTQLTGLADNLFAQGATDTREQAEQVIFNLKSTGQLGSIDTFRRMGRAGLVGDLGQTAVGAAGAQYAFGKEEVGTFNQLIAKAFAAGELAGNATAEQLMSAAGEIGAGMSVAGISDEETLTALGLLSNLGGLDQAKTRVERFVEATELKGIGGTLQERVSAVQDLGLDAPGLKTFLGNTRALKGFQQLSQDNIAAQYASALASVEAANQDPEALNRKLAFLDPESASATAKRQAEAQRALASRDYAIYENIREGELAKQKSYYDRMHQEGNIAQRMYATGIMGSNAIIQTTAPYLGLINAEKIVDELASEGGYGGWGISQGGREALNELRELKRLQEGRTQTMPE